MIIKQNYFEENIRKILANNIVYFRLKRNMSQEEFADKLGTTPNYVSYIENCKKNMRVDYIGHVADILGVTPEQLFTERENVKNHRIPRR